MIRFALVLALLAAVAAPQPPAHARDRISGDFALGRNAEGQDCRAAEHFDATPGRSFDIFCGAWERPSGRLTVTADPASAQAGWTARCNAPGASLAGSGFEDLRQAACAPPAQGIRRFGLFARRAGQVVYGTAYPADWAPLLRAAEVATGLSRPSAVASDAASAGLSQIQSAYPDGAPGQTAENNYELLRQRAYAKNVMWNFGSAGDDFADLLAAHRRVAPEDLAGEAEIEAEVALNLSDARRFEEAQDALDNAEAEAARAGDPLLQSKVLNYRATHLLNGRRYALAYAMAERANALRATLDKEPPPASGEGFRVTASEAWTASQRAGDRGPRSALVRAQGSSRADRLAILSAQGWYLKGAAARALGRPDARACLEKASTLLAGVAAPPAWLTALTQGELARVRLAGGDPAGARSAVQSGLWDIRTVAPGSRAEGHLLMTAVLVDARAGRRADALADGRQSMAIFAAQRESPGLPSQLAEDYLSLLSADWSQSHDPAIAEAEFQTAALVWDGAAARSAAQLAARLASGEASGEVRAYQDAERLYRAALARRQRLQGDPDAPAEVSAAADRGVQDAGKALETAEARLRSRSPRYLELLGPSLKAADLQAVLRPGEGYLRLVSADKAGFGVLVTRDGVHPYEIAATGPEMAALAGKVRATSAFKGRRLPDYDVQSAVRLYDLLLRPLEPQLGGLKRLEIDAPGALAALPFAALVTAHLSDEQAAHIRDDQDYAGVPWLARRLAVSSAVGPAAFVRVRQAKDAAPHLTAAAFGAFQPAPLLSAQRLGQANALSERCQGAVRLALSRLPALPSTAEEAQAAGALFGASARVRTGAAFTDADFMDAPEVGQAGVIMVATHGVLGLSDCFPEPALVTSVGDKGDGLIEASELLDRRLTADVVVLSACDTAGGGRANVERTGFSDGGEALSGLARGFLYAGARSVLATQWQVDAETSGAEVQQVFQGALHDGLPLADALNRAQAQLYDSPETAHPFYWAGFTLIGDGGATLGAPARQTTTAP